MINDKNREIERLQKERQERDDEDEARLRELEEDDEIYSKKKSKKQEKRTEWTDDDYNLLVKLLNKFPGGASNRYCLLSALTVFSNLTKIVMSSHLFTKIFRIG